jgi:copper chaperone
MRFKVAGMNCGHCIKTVTGAVEAVLPSAQVSIDLATGLVEVQSDDEAKRDLLKTAIERSGYTVADETL